MYVAERDYHEKCLEPKSKNVSSCSRFHVNNQVTNDKKIISEGFDSYFVNVGPTLSTQIPANTGTPTGFMERNSNSMAILPVTSTEVTSIITNLKHNRPGWDSISAAITKAVYLNFIGPLTYILNMSITEGAFPSGMKLAKVMPLFKANDPL